MNKLEISLGCDPEVFLGNYSVKGGSIIPACGLIGGTKKNPLKIEGTETFIQEDGVAVEFNTPAVTGDPGDFIEQVHDSYADVERFVRNKDANFFLKTAAYHKFNKSDLLSAQATTLGCDPDLLAHERGRTRVPPTIEELGNYRCTGGHVHVGYDKDTSGVPGYAMIQLIEAGAYYPCFLGSDNQGVRRQFYGLPGLYREKNYGVEYRTPSSYWMYSGPGEDFVFSLFKIARWVANHRTEAQSLWSDLDFETIKKDIISENPSRNYVETVIGYFRQYGAL